MNPVTLRRLLVFGVCAVGVGALYLAPNLTGQSGEVAAPAPDDEPTSLPVGTATSASTATTRSTPRPSPATSGDAAPGTPAGTAAGPDPAPRTTRPVSTGATAYDPDRDSDHVAPDPVADITTTDVTRDRLTVRWPAAKDDVGVLRYRVVLNGFTVATTSQTHATVRWFNDDLGAHVIQVRALDAAGNESPTSPNLLVSRPTTSPSPSPSPTATPESPSPSPSPSASSPAPSVDPSGNPSPNAADQQTSAEATASATTGAG